MPSTAGLSRDPRPLLHGDRARPDQHRPDGHGPAGGPAPRHSRERRSPVAARNWRASRRRAPAGARPQDDHHAAGDDQDEHHWQGANEIDVGRARAATPVAATASYTVLAGKGRTLTLTGGGHVVGTFNAPLTVVGSAAPDGRRPRPLPRRARLLAEPLGGVQIVNDLDLEDYVRGVMSAEVPPSWPTQALEAMAVAMRTFAITATPVSSHYDLYPDTRSQMYKGVSAETPSTNAAVLATRRADRDLPGPPRGDVLLRELGRVHREHSERMARLGAGTMAGGGARPLRRRRREPVLSMGADAQPPPGDDRSERPRQGDADRDPDYAARRLTDASSPRRSSAPGV